MVSAHTPSLVYLENWRLKASSSSSCRAVIISDVLSKDMISMHFRIEFICLIIITRESIQTVWNLQSTIYCPLQSSENLGTSRCSVQTDIQVASECTRSVIYTLDIVFITINFLLTLVCFMKIQLG